MDPHQKEQDETLHILVDAEVAGNDSFLTATAGGRTTVFHDGLGENGQHDLSMPCLKGLVQRRLLTVIAYRDHDDFSFAITEEGREYIQRLALGGMTALEALADRAQCAERALSDFKNAVAETEQGRRARRRMLASWVAGMAAVAVAVLVGLFLFDLSENPAYRVAVGIAGGIGVTGTLVYQPTRSFLVRIFVGLLTIIHDHT